MKNRKRSSGRAPPADRRRIGRRGSTALALLCATAAAALFLAHYYRLGVAATLVIILVGLPALYVAWAAYQVAQRDAGGATDLSLPKIADQLADAVHSQWVNEAAARGLNDRYPLSVSWTAADKYLADDWDVLLRLASSGVGWSAPEPEKWAKGPEDLAGGEERKLIDVLATVPTGRLVVLGEPGAGKTVLMVRLVLDLLARRGKGGPVPVLAELASWDPVRQDLHSWLAAQLIIDHPALAAAPPGSGEGNWIQALLAADLIRPILDGLDEIPEPVRGLAITSINDVLRPGEALVVTCRTEQYRDVVGSPNGPATALQAAAAIQLCPLLVTDIEDYLRAPATPNTADRWRKVFERLATETTTDNKPDGPLANTLANPLMLWLAKTIYNPRPGEQTGALRDPAELCNAALADRTAIEAHLLERFVPAVYSPRAGSVKPRWTPEQARRWLTFLAYAMERTRTADLAWWRLYRAVRGWRPLAVAIRSMLLFAVAWLLASWLLHLHPRWRTGFGLRSLLAAGPLGRQIVPLLGYIQGVLPTRVSHEVRSTADAIIGFFPWHSLASLELWVALLGAAVGLLSATLEIWVQPGELHTRKIRSLHAPDSYIRALLSLMGAALGILILPLFLLLFPGLSIRHNGHPILGTLVHMQSVRVLLLLVILWMIPGSFKFTEPLELSQSVGPVDVLRLDRQASLLAILQRRIFRLLLIWLYFGPLIALACAIYIASFLLCKVLLGRGNAGSDFFADARIWLATGRRMPWRIMTFLTDAHQRGILRQSGTVYQFRHIRLQEQLSAQYPPLSFRLASAAVSGMGGYKGPLWGFARSWSPKSTAPWSRPFWAVRFQEFARKAQPEAGSRVVQAGMIRNEGPGCVQPFRILGGEAEGQSWVACAVPGKEPVLVAQAVWQALRNAGAQALQKAGREDSDNALAAVGFPAGERSRLHSWASPGYRRLLSAISTPTVIGASATSVLLSEGWWGMGLLQRDQVESDWCWEPKWSFRTAAGSMAASRHGSRLQIGASVHYSTASRLAIAPAVYKILPDKLADSDLSHAVTDLFVQRGTEPPEVRWQKWKDLGLRDRRVVVWVIAGSQKAPKLFVQAGAELYRTERTTYVTATAVLLAEDATAWPNLLRPNQENLIDEIFPFSLNGVAAFLAAAWHTAAEVLPTLIVEGLFATRPKHAPSTILNLGTYSQLDEKLKRRDLRKLVDFSPFAMRDDGQLTYMTAMVLGPLQLSPADRAERTRQALTLMGQDAGFNTGSGGWPKPA